VAIKRLPDPIIEAIKKAPLSEKPEELAERLSVEFDHHVGTTSVKKYRAQAEADQRQEEAQARTKARREVALAAGDGTKAALDHLEWLMQAAQERYDHTGKANDGRLLLACIEVHLREVVPNESELNAEIDRELRRLDNLAGQAPKATPGETPPPGAVPGG
jgi:hypothetical protein